MNIEEIRKALKDEYDFYDKCYNEWENNKDSNLYVRESNFNEGFCMGLGFALDLIGWTGKEKDWNAIYKNWTGKEDGRDFIDDECKMVDFLALNKDEFLSSYSYLDSKDWNATYKKVLEILAEHGFSMTFEEELGHEACKWSVNGECTLMCDDNYCNGTPNEKWECAYCEEV